MVFEKGGRPMAREKARFTVNLTTELADQVDAYADEMGINRTSAVSVLLSMALNSQKAMSDLGKLMKAYEDEQKKLKTKE